MTATLKSLTGARDHLGKRHLLPAGTVLTVLWASADFAGAVECELAGGRVVSVPGSRLLVVQTQLTRDAA